MLPSLLGGIVTLLGFRPASVSDTSLGAVLPVHLALGGLYLTVLGRSAPHAANAWQRNALLADASCVAGDEAMHACGSLVSAIDLQSWHHRLVDFMDGGDIELKLGCSSDCLSIELHRPLHGDRTAVSVCLAPPGGDVGIEALRPASKASRKMAYTVSRDELLRFCADVAMAMQSYPVHHGHAILPL